MSMSSILDTIVSISLQNLTPPAPHRFHLVPGDWACVDPDISVGMGDDAAIPLLLRTAYQALEREAFTGRACNEITGWIFYGDIAIVAGVEDDYAYLFGPHGRGWADRQYVCRIQDISD